MKKQLSTLGKDISREPKDSASRVQLYAKKRKFKTLIQNKKVTFKDNIIKDMRESESDPKQFWKLLEQLKSEGADKTDFVASIEPERWIEMFQGLLYDPNNNTDCRIKRDELQKIPYIEISIEEMINSLKKLKGGKSPGLDGVLNEMIICLADRYPHLFKNLFNKLLDIGIFPSTWTNSVIIPLHEKGSKSDEKNYRGIALLSCIGKFFNVIINERIIDFAHANNIIQPEQLGFMKGNRTSDNLMILHSIVRSYFSKKGGNKVYAAFIDFEKAYDKIPRRILIEKVRKFGLNGNIVNVIEDMYRNDKSCIRIRDKGLNFLM